MGHKLEYEAPSWNDIYHMLLCLADKIKGASFKPDIIVGVSRGGWPPARVLSDLLDNPNLANVRVEFYVGVGETKNQPVLTQPVSMNVKDKKVLVVDEVADTGKSLELIKRHLLDMGAKDVKIATVYYKPWSVVMPDYYVTETTSWIVFPWEIRETLMKIVRKCRESNKPLDEEISKLLGAGLSKEIVDKFLKEILEEKNC